MKILNVGLNYHIQGGSDRYLMDLEKLLKKKGHEVVPFAAQHIQNQETPYSKYFPRGGVQAEGINPKSLVRLMYNFEAKRSLDQLISNYPLDIAHLHIYYGKLTTAILDAIKKHKVPIVQTCHEYKLICPVYTLFSQGKICTACAGTRFYKAFTKQCNKGSMLRSMGIMVESYVSRWNGDNRKVDHFITVSEFQREEIIKTGVVSPDKITAIHNFLHTENFNPKYDPGDYFLFFGRLNRTKGVHTLIEAAGEIDDMPLYIVGEGPERRALETRVQEKGWKHISFLGFKTGEELACLLQNSRCNVIPSEWYETFGLTAIESYAYGKPVIGAAIGGITEVIEDGHTGFLFTSGNVAELRERLLWMRDHETEVETMGKRARIVVEKKFGPDLHYQRLQNVYQRVL